jgi:hypothetical protein
MFRICVVMREKAMIRRGGIDNGSGVDRGAARE